MKIIVFGGSGFIGSHLSEALVKEGHEVTIFDIKLWENVLCAVLKPQYRTDLMMYFWTLLYTANLLN